MHKAAVLLLLACALHAYAQGAPVQNGQAPDTPAAEKPAPSSFAKSDRIQITLTSISHEVYGPMKEGAMFKAGDTVCVNITLEGLKANEQNQVTVQADLYIPELGLDSKNLMDDSTKADSSIPMYFRIPIGEVEQAGVCNVMITIRDMNAKTRADFATAFRLSNEIITFHCDGLISSMKYSYKDIEKKMPGIQKQLEEHKFQKAGEVLVTYTNTRNTQVAVIVPKETCADYLVVPAARRLTAGKGCGKAFELFHAAFLFKSGDMEFYRAFTK